MTSGKGMELMWTDANGQHEVTLTWNKVASVLLTLIREGRYSENLPPFPPEEPEWTLFSFAEQIVENKQDKRRIENDQPSTTRTRSQQALSPDVDNLSQSSIGSVAVATAPANTVSMAINYRFDPAHSPYVPGLKSKYKRNVEAIRLLKRLDDGQRQATPDEQQVLAGYVGWGGLANAFHPTASGWENEYEELKQLLDEDEYATARNSTITAFYTEQAIIQPIHDTLKRFGLTDGTGRKLLEPSMGSGNFFSVLPPEWEKAELHGVELDPLTGRIARQLYPTANIRLQGFETVDWKNTRFDAMFSNVPFHNIRVFDKHYTSNYLIHDYFFIKSLDLLKPGGILAYIVSKGTLDKQDSSVRKLLAQQAEWIGAIRLPNTTFQSLSGTTVTTDIVFLQKRTVPVRFSNEEWPEWVEVGQTPGGVPLNRYYLSHPEMVLGRMIWDRGIYGPEQTTACVPLEGQEFFPALKQALGSLQANIPSLPVQSPHLHPLEVTDNDEPERREAPVGVKNNSYVVEDDRIYYCENGEMLAQDIQGKKAERIKGLCEIRSALLDVIDIQSREEGYEDAELATAQRLLNQVYDRFVRSYGAINERANKSAFSDDDQLPLLRSIEDFTPQKTWVKAAIFSRPTIRPNRFPERVESALEALQVCLNQRLRIDLPYIAFLCNKTTADVREELGERIYLNPQKYNGDIDEGWELDEEYLSGHVKDKLAYAALKAREHPDLFTRNVDALTRVQPAPLLPGDIDFRIGSPWIPVRYYRDFMYETFGTSQVLQNSQTVDVDYLEYTNTWRVTGKSLERDSIKVHQTYGTPRVNAYEIFENSLNLQSVTVRDPVTYLDANGNEQIKYVINAKETMIARAKQQQMREAFASWLFRDKERANTLLAIYNDKFNTIRPRHYDGEHLVFFGMSEEMELRKHQKDVAARILYQGTALMAHEVGAGKTAAMIAAGMTLKRIGAAQKPMYCVPNHLTEQWANEFLRFYPGANILVTTKKDFTPANRQRFVSRIAMGDYDAIIIGHSQFEKIPISRERQERLLEDEIRNVARMIDQMKKEKGDDWSIKQMVVFENNLKSRLERLANEKKKDDLLTFEQLGVDMLFVDEAHAYKNCFTYTKMRNVAGIGKSSSQRATDMMLKCQYLQEVNNGRGVVFATGTPISNSMSEMYVMQRYLQPLLLQKLGLDFFDNWAATFGEVVTSLEMTPEGSGYRMKSRFAKFHNLPELMSLFRLVADIQTADMLNLPTPKLKEEKATVVISECSPFQQQIMDDFVVRAEKIRKNEVDASEDNMLKLTHEAKLMSIDPRLLDEDAPSDPHSKLNRCIGNVFDIWQQTLGDRLTQVIFCDSGTPKPGQFNVYDEIKVQLTSRGVPEEEIAFIHDAKTDVQREELFESVRRGGVRILLGSTVKMGTGTNVQDRLIAAHHLDCPWRPADITQRDGRILRQGNRNEMVQIFRYVTKGTFDAYLWQIQEQKLRYISQVMTGKSISRSCEDADETVLTAAEVKAVATGNPLLAEKMHVDNEVARLKLLKANWQNEQTVLENKIQKSYPAMIAACDEKAKKILTDIQTADQNRQTSFSIQIDGKTYEERPEAGEILLLLANMTDAGQPTVQIGQYCGFPLSLSRSIFESVHLQIHGAETYFIELGESALGNLSRLENLIAKIPAMLRDIEQSREDTLLQLAAAQKEIGKPFEEEQKLQQLVARQSEIDFTLEFKELQDPVIMQLGNELDENLTNDVEIEAES
ncbi:helicase [Paenibacillus faecis]|uniref:Helicase n=2 Tax=Paenibacillus faecis TaxID=862114 RepID=A0A5D0CZN1_9BACL|nr:helicase [Paenibacillus faecis]